MERRRRGRERVQIKGLLGQLLYWMGAGMPTSGAATVPCAGGPHAASAQLAVIRLIRAMHTAGAMRDVYSLLWGDPAEEDGWMALS